MTGWSVVRRLRIALLGMALALAAAGIALAVFVVVSSDQLARNAQTPPRLPLDQSPRDYGIDIYQEVVFTASDGVVLHGWAAPTQNGAAIVLAHGYAANRAQLLPEAGLLAQAGFGVLLFDFRGHGESDAARVTLGDHERRDLRAAIDFLAGQPGVDPDRLGAVGFSMGGATLAQVAAEDGRLAAVVIEGTYPALEDLIRYRMRLFGPLGIVPALRVARQAGDVDDVRPVDDLCAISPRPLLLIYGALDRDMPDGTAQRMAAAACEPSALWVIEGARHGDYLEAAPDEYPTRLIEFFTPLAEAAPQED